MKGIRRTLICSALIAAAGIAASWEARAEVVYNRGNSADPETLDPHKTSTVYEAHILRDLFEGLVAEDAAGELIPGAASSWTVSEDGLVYTFALNPEGRWSNGEPVTADDFVFSMRRLVDPATAAQYATMLYPIQNAEAVNTGGMPADQLGVRAIDPATLEVTLAEPTPFFLELLTHQSAYPVNPASVEELGSDFIRPGQMVSNGAYTLTEFIPNDHITLKKNPEFHDAANVAIDTVNYFPTEDRSAALRRFQSGELLSNDDVPVEQIGWIRENMGEQFISCPYLGTYYFTVNTQKPPLDDVRVRRALSMAIDREFLAEEIWGGTMLPGYSLVPPGINNYGEPAYLDYKDLSMFDREERAAELLAEAGYGPDNPLRVEIRYNTSENHRNTSTAIASMWEPLGVQVSLVNSDTATHYALLRERGDYDIARAGWIGDYSDPQNFLNLLVSWNPRFNYARWENPRFDELMRQSAKTADLDERARLMQQAEAIVAEEEPYFDLLTYASKNLVSPKLKGFVCNTLDHHPTRFLSIEP
ncbi:peptide ABC transporter substrate-binding protein [Marinivivus vitaminiproducens]|uniref:peptide ABC transporter substrate-binding protein n=1 Tax=Marinivivus vitaminiproducens TaxID=3035935 RepID=UPI0027A7349C|nr:peptide ABC transporter substrate-binding protein [Geminicoccaceae bacterium SCSIO 64248]